ncbi:helix-turn-helix domain-containing protein [Streptomyces albidoflavus]
MAKIGPAGRMQLGRALAALRDRAGLTQSEVASGAGVSIGTVNRYEGWQDLGALRVPTVRAIAEACGATAEERDSLVTLLTSQERGWWLDHPTLPEILNPLVSFEAAASYERVWANLLVPGLLQTPDYAYALHRDAAPTASEDELRAAVDIRMRRQRSRPPRLEVVMTESVLRDVVGGTGVMVAQIDHLLEVSADPRIDLRVLPRGRSHVAGSGGHFVQLGRDDGEGEAMAVVYLELHRRGLYLDGAGDVDEYRMMFNTLHAAAADAETSKALLGLARQEHTR